MYVCDFILQTRCQINFCVMAFLKLAECNESSFRNYLCLNGNQVLMIRPKLKVCCSIFFESFGNPP